MASKGNKQAPGPTALTENLSGSSSRHTVNTNPPSVQSKGGGKISPNSHKRGKQG